MQFPLQLLRFAASHMAAYAYQLFQIPYLSRYRLFRVAPNFLQSALPLSESCHCPRLSVYGAASLPCWSQEGLSMRVDLANLAIRSALLEAP